MTKAEVLTQLSVWVRDVCDQEDLSLSAETDLVQDLGLDSLALAEVASLARSTFKIKLRPGEVHQDFRAGALADLILSRLAKD